MTRGKIPTYYGVYFNVEIGHTIEEWNEAYGVDSDFWAISIDDMLEGAVEPNEDMLYWAIDGYLYETDIDA